MDNQNNNYNPNSSYGNQNYNNLNQNQPYNNQDYNTSNYNAPNYSPNNSNYNMQNNNTSYQMNNANSYNPQNQYPNQNPQYNTKFYDQIPDEVNRWNWGAFMFSIFWGIGNKSYLVFLTLIPYVSFIMQIICGALGNKWAWKNTRYLYDTDEEFIKAAKSWNRAGFYCFIFSICIIALSIILLIVLVQIISKTPHPSY